MFTTVEFTKEMTEPVGLKPALLRGLSKVVILAGPNGLPTKETADVH